MLIIVIDNIKTISNNVDEDMLPNKGLYIFVNVFINSFKSIVNVEITTNKLRIGIIYIFKYYIFLFFNINLYE